MEGLPSQMTCLTVKHESFSFERPWTQGEATVAAVFNPDRDNFSFFGRSTQLEIPGHRGTEKNRETITGTKDQRITLESPTIKRIGIARVNTQLLSPPGPKPLHLRLECLHLAGLRQLACRHQVSKLPSRKP